MKQTLHIPPFSGSLGPTHPWELGKKSGASVSAEQPVKTALSAQTHSKWRSACPSLLFLAINLSSWDLHIFFSIFNLLITCLGQGSQRWVGGSRFPQSFGKPVLVLSVDGKCLGEKTDLNLSAWIQTSAPLVARTIQAWGESLKCIGLLRLVVCTSISNVAQACC